MAQKEAENSNVDQHKRLSTYYSKNAYLVSIPDSLIIIGASRSSRVRDILVSKDLRAI